MATEPEFKYKQCIIIRNDVKMSCGKKCAQAGHAAIGAYERSSPTLKKAWMNEGQKKVVLKASDQKTLFELKTLADSAGIAAIERSPRACATAPWPTPSPPCRRRSDQVP